MSNASNLSTLANVLDDGTSGQFLKSTGSGGVAFDTVAAGAVVYATADLLPLSGNSAGDMAYVTATNRFYINNGSGWYSVSLVNTNPNITSVQDAGSNTTPFTLATDGTATVITVTAADPEEVPLTYDYSVTSGSLNGSTVTKGTGSNSNVFTVTPHASQDATFTITFTASDGINQATSANAFSLSFVTTVADSNHTTLLATATSTGGNVTIEDSSTANSGSGHSITVIGDAHAGTFSPYRSGGYSTYFDGTNGLMAPTATGTTLQGDTTFTVEFWYNTKTVATGNKVIWGSRSNSSNSNNDDTIGRMFQTGGSLYYTVNGSTVLNTSSVISANTWCYIALVVDSGSASLYLDGARIATGTYTSANGSDRIIVGHTANTPQQYIADFRINTAAEYSGTSHTVPTEPLLTTSDTVFHLPTKGYLATDLILTGTPSKTPFSPYDYNEYDATDHGGSVFFEGGDYLTVADHNDFNLTSDFTIKFWAWLNVPYAYSGNVTYGLFDNFSYNNGGLRVCINGSGLQNGKLVLYWNSAWDTVTAEQFNFIPEKNQWYYYELTRSSNTLTVKVNGESVGTVNVTNLTNPTTSLTIGNNTGVGTGQSSGTSNYNNYLYGYISDFQYITGGTASESSVPIAPMSTDTNSKLHLKGTDASIIDKSQSANLKLEGTASGSTDQVRPNAWANTKTMKFDGNSDYLTFPDRTELNFASNDWTIECWIYPKTNVGDCGIWHQSASGGTDWFSLYLDGSFNPKFVLKNNNAEEWTGTAAANTAPQNTWTHLALVRKFGTGVYLYAGGTLIASDTGDASVAMEDKTYNHVIGYERFVGNGTYFDGYIQDFRITNGLARYIDAQNPTTSFTPPSAPLEG